jgi:hypothetical protein
LNQSRVILDINAPVDNLVECVSEFLALLPIVSEKMSKWTFNLDEQIVVRRLPKNEVRHMISKPQLGPARYVGRAE